MAADFAYYANHEGDGKILGMKPMTLGLIGAGVLVAFLIWKRRRAAATRCSAPLKTCRRAAEAGWTLQRSHPPEARTGGRQGVRGGESRSRDPHIIEDGSGCPESWRRGEPHQELGIWHEASTLSKSSSLQEDTNERMPR